MALQDVEPIVSLEKTYQDVAADSIEVAMGLEALTNLWECLNQHGVRYCHWKSNLRLEKALCGQTDLDLLVDRVHSQIFRRILNKQNIKPLQAAPGKQYPGVENYLGYDPGSGKLFHLHVHYQLVLGEQFVKNYRLPLEDYFFSAVQCQHGVKLPAPELELIVLSIRALLKYRDRDVIKDMFSIRSPGLPASILEEINWLLAQTTMEAIIQTLNKVRHIVPVEIVMTFLRIIPDTPRAGYQLYRLRSDLRQALHPYQRDNRWLAAGRYFKAIWRRRFSWPGSSSNQKMTSSNGGETLALVGADGSGKSTASQILCKWLGWKLDVHRFYLGSKSPSQRSKLTYILFRIARRSHRTISRLVDDQNIAARLIIKLRQALLYTHYLSLGVDRHRHYLLSKRKAAGGSIIIFDRFPLDAILDGPKIRWATGGEMDTLARAFGRLEQAIYAKIRPPDYLIVLNVNPDVSLQRKPEHHWATVEAKSEFLKKLSAPTSSREIDWTIYRIDANQPLEIVLSQLKGVVWEVL